MVWSHKLTQVLVCNRRLLSMALHVKDRHLVGQRALRQIASWTEAQSVLQAHPPIVSFAHFGLNLQCGFAFKSLLYLGGEAFSVEFRFEHRCVQL